MDINYLVSRVEYDPLTGVFTWKRRTDANVGAWWNTRFANKVAGGISKAGDTSYWTIRIDGTLFLAHRLAWMIYHGEVPNIIDHINMDTLDNRIENLRNVDRVVNGRNSRRKSNNTSGVNGVYWHKQIGRWCAEGHYTESGIHKKKFLGSFVNIEDATRAREVWEESEGNFTETHGKYF